MGRNMFFGWWKRWRAERTRTEILSKDDARAIFSMTKDQWLTNVEQAAAAGKAGAMGTPETGFGMAMKPSRDEFLIVKPDYGDNAQKPDFISVTVGHRGRKGTRLTESALADAVQAAKAQMEPEYDVIGNVDKAHGGVSVSFIITENK